MTLSSSSRPQPTPSPLQPPLPARARGHIRTLGGLQGTPAGGARTGAAETTLIGARHGGAHREAPVFDDLDTSQHDVSAESPAAISANDGAQLSAGATHFGP